MSDRRWGRVTQLAYLLAIALGSFVAGALSVWAAMHP